MRQCLSHLLLLFCLLAMGGCDEAASNARPGDPPVSPSTSSSPEQPSLTMTAIRPAYHVVDGLEMTTDLKLHAWWNDQSNDVVSADAWSSEDPNVATVDNAGHVTTVGEGETLIHATYQNEDAIARIVVHLPPSSPLPPHGNPGGTTGPGGATGSTGPATPPDTGPHEDPPPSPQAPYADRVVSYVVGDGGGFHQDRLPDIVLGPPKGLGLYIGSYDVFSLGVGGQIILEFTDYLAFDGTGDDFIVFENAFQVGMDPNSTFAEPGVVSVSEDGVTYVDFPCDLSGPPYAGCAGVHPTLANPDTNTIDPTDPSVAGGDAFDLADVGLKKVRFLKIQDSGLGLGPIGPGTRGFDLDAVAIHHGTLP